MGFSILERFVQGKYRDQRLCQDYIFVTSHHVAVLDGSSLGPARDGMPQGRILCEAAGAAIAALPAACDHREAMVAINHAIRSALDYAGSEAVRAHPQRASASAVIYSAAHRQLWCVGDTGVTVDGAAIELSKEIDRVATAARCAYVAALVANGATPSSIIASQEDKVFLRPLLALQQQSFLNRLGNGPYRYGNLDGDDAVLDFVRVIDVGSAQLLTLATDGYFLRLGDLDSTELAMHVVVEADPCMYRLHPQVKGLSLDADGSGLLSLWFDDRAWIRIRQE